MLQKGFTQCHNNLRTKKISEKIFKLESENNYVSAEGYLQVVFLSQVTEGCFCSYWAFPTQFHLVY